jgi:hypothetical protein
VGGNSFAGNSAYVDNALPITQYRLRFDAAYDDNRPDRADFFYPKCGCFRVNGMDPNAPGPGADPAKRVNFQELSNYVEIALNPRFSVFGDIPVRWVDISFKDPGFDNEHHSGLSDIDFGFKYAMVYNPTQVLTLQLRTYAPTGDAEAGLGRNNWVVEPGLLYYRRLSDRLYLDAELKDFIPIDSADDFAGNVLEYGFALSYLLYNRPNFRIFPVGEMVGWTVLSGQELSDSGTVSAKGDTIVNAKFGIRFGFGELVKQDFLLSRADFYVGYGRALTGEVWYKDLLRAEFRLRF